MQRGSRKTTRRKLQKQTDKFHEGVKHQNLLDKLREKMEELKSSLTTADDQVMRLGEITIQMISAKLRLANQEVRVLRKIPVDAESVFESYRLLSYLQESVWLSAYRNPCSSADGYRQEIESILAELNCIRVPALTRAFMCDAQELLDVASRVLNKACDFEDFRDKVANDIGSLTPQNFLETYSHSERSHPHPWTQARKHWRK